MAQVRAEPMRRGGRSRRRSATSKRWMPLLAIVLGLLLTAALGRLAAATWSLLQDGARRVSLACVENTNEAS
ncbi:MAG: hypothetical protein PVJ57_13820 [Phycisphaerae bacterium]|jgi:hypothetical protein